MNALETRPTPAIAKPKGRPVGYSPAKAEAKPAVNITIEGDEVVIRLPKKDLSRKLLADLI